MGLTPAERRAVVGMAVERSLRLLSVCSHVKICAPGNDQVVLRALVEHLRLAADLGA